MATRGRGSHMVGLAGGFLSTAQTEVSEVIPPILSRVSNAGLFLLGLLVAANVVLVFLAIIFGGRRSRR